ncbi:S-layer homology domain-containing protein [Desulfotomaculum arcticum]|uniref:S-layer homology domain-containing protein n=1 Tax=Desulfotruncus arcticus DSM 17038 TaxID=1121424 RepID=A0A1I2QGJ4_9FIRM|nr:S-layer homology domain-containing protein [Desulfotruncus arcticus]SFG25357.1 S-layer homology domain-containing protein [Desulfotomaculum arcticum] [Desulfotruncus arcticus DSM 17038]
MGRLKKALSMVAALTIFFLMLPQALASGFPDTKGHWAEPEIKTMAEKGIIGGYPDGNFYPSKNVSRRELAKIVFSLFPQATGLETGKVATYPDYPDVSQGWGQNYLQAAELFLPGYTDGTFKPDQPATRHEVALLALTSSLINNNKYRMDDNKLIIEMPLPDSSSWKTLVGFREFQDLPEKYSKSTAYFQDDPYKTDFYQFAGYFYSDLNPEALLAGKKILTGYGDGRLSLDNGVTRAETVVIINRILAADFSNSDKFLLEPAGKVYRTRTVRVNAAGANSELDQLGLFYKNKYQDPLTRARMVYNFMIHSFNYDWEAREGVSSYAVQGVSEVMNSGRALEQELAQFYATLAGKAGLQAITVSGKAINSGDTGDHTWVELNLAGKKIEVDPTYGVCTGDLFFNNFDYWRNQGYQWNRK